jgi:hypothetical protein
MHTVYMYGTVIHLCVQYMTYTVQDIAHTLHTHSHADNSLLPSRILRSHQNHSIKNCGSINVLTC